jgi:hypothetical protein
MIGYCKGMVLYHPLAIIKAVQIVLFIRFFIRNLRFSIFENSR